MGTVDADDRGQHWDACRGRVCSGLYFQMDSPAVAWEMLGLNPSSDGADGEELFDSRAIHTVK